jgi:hypothetical protein
MRSAGARIRPASRAGDRPPAAQPPERHGKIGYLVRNWQQNRIFGPYLAATHRLLVEGEVGATGSWGSGQIDRLGCCWLPQEKAAPCLGLALEQARRCDWSACLFLEHPHKLSLCSSIRTSGLYIHQTTRIAAPAPGWLALAPPCGASSVPWSASLPAAPRSAAARRRQARAAAPPQAALPKRPRQRPAPSVPPRHPGEQRQHATFDQRASLSVGPAAPSDDGAGAESVCLTASSVNRRL